MSQYRARDLFRVPSLLSLARLPLAALFTAVRDAPVASLAILAVAGLTDVADGWYARRYRQVTAMGIVVDPLTDKAFVLTVLATLILRDALTPWSALLLGTREIGELPLVAWYAVSHRARGDKAEQPSANVPGKVATAMQFATVAGALFRAPFLDALVLATALAGALAAASYWARALGVRSRAAP